jgi:hypothetical protein
LQKRIQYIARAKRPRASPGRANGRGTTSGYGNAVSSIATAPVAQSSSPIIVVLAARRRNEVLGRDIVRYVENFTRKCAVLGLWTSLHAMPSLLR